MKLPSAAMTSGNGSAGAGPSRPPSRAAYTYMNLNQCAQALHTTQNVYGLITDGHKPKKSKGSGEQRERRASARARASRRLARRGLPSSGSGSVQP